METPAWYLTSHHKFILESWPPKSAKTKWALSSAHWSQRRLGANSGLHTDFRKSDSQNDETCKHMQGWYIKSHLIQNAVPTNALDQDLNGRYLQETWRNMVCSGPFKINPMIWWCSTFHAKFLLHPGMKPRAPTSSLGYHSNTLLFPIVLPVFFHVLPRFPRNRRKAGKNGKCKL